MRGRPLTYTFAFEGEAPLGDQDERDPVRLGVVDRALLQRSGGDEHGLLSSDAHSLAVEDLNELSFDRMGVVLGLDHD